MKILEQKIRDIERAEQIAENIRVFRARNRMSQKDLSAVLGISTTTISHLERGHIYFVSENRLNQIENKLNGGQA